MTGRQCGFKVAHVLQLLSEAKANAEGSSLGLWVRADHRVKAREGSRTRCIGRKRGHSYSALPERIQARKETERANSGVSKQDKT